MSKQRKSEPVRVALGSLGVQVLAEPYPGKFYCMVPFGAIKFAKYQRNTDGGHVRKIACRFDVRAAQPLQIGFRDGSLWCYDGGHRIGAMKNLGYTEHTAEIIVSSYGEEAKLFYYLNDGHKDMSGWKKFSSALEGGEAVQAEIIEVVRANMLSTPMDADVAVASRADLPTPGGLLEAYRVLGRDGLNLVCRVLNESWRLSPTNGKDGSIRMIGDINPIAKKIDIIRGLIDFIKLNAYDKDLPPDYEGYLVYRLAKYTPEKIQAIARGKVSKGRIDRAQYRQAIIEVCQVKRKRSA